MTQPNILIVMTDHQRADTVRPEHAARTPNAERLAREGVTFTQAYCPSPHCCPSRAAFHSGLYPSRSGVWNNVGNEQRLSWGLHEGVRLWSQDLREAGYELYYTQRWVQTARHRYVFNGFDFDELYDLQTDPHELRNLAEDSASAALKHDLARQTWQLARAENDSAINPYITVGLAPLGPGAVAEHREKA